MDRLRIKDRIEQKRKMIGGLERKGLWNFLNKNNFFI